MFYVNCGWVESKTRSSIYRWVLESRVNWIPRHTDSTPPGFQRAPNVIKRRISKFQVYDEIRNSYRSAILHSHPDKLNGCSSDEKFLKIQKAWQVLSDAELRVVYDNDLRSSRLDGVTADELIQNCLVQLWKFSGKLFDFCTHLC
ncbi:hypothetical protein YC2023_018374 [Brassica napus]